MASRPFIQTLVCIVALAAAHAAAEGPPATLDVSVLERVNDTTRLSRPLKAVAMQAPRNGFDSAQFVVSNLAAASTLEVTADDLSGPDGASLPAATIQIRYASTTGRFVALHQTSPAGAARAAVWLTARVPASAKPGAYAARLRIRSGDRETALPISLTVHAYTAPDPRHQLTKVGVLQSPESVAGHYKVPLWSDRHFELMQPSLALMGRAGNDVLTLSAVRKDVFGNHPILAFRADGGAMRPDFAALDRYLRLYDRLAGPPQFVSLQVWSYGMYYKGYGRDGGREESRASTIPVVETRDGRRVEAELPIYGDGDSQATWTAVMDGLRQRLDDLGWKDTQILLGTGGDTWPSATTVAFFRRIAPRAQWRVLTHGCGSPFWGTTDLRRTQPNGMVVGYLTCARRLRNSRESSGDHPVTCNSRDEVKDDPRSFRSLATVLVHQYGYDGVDWKGIDYWPHPGPDGKPVCALQGYCHFGNMVGSTPPAMAAAGPEGALSTIQYEMFLHGIQECEALLQVRTALQAPRVRCDAIDLRLEDAVFHGDPSKRQPLMAALLLDGAGGIAVKASAPTYNTGARTGEAREVESQRGRRFELNLTIADDAWVKGGKGTYSLELDPIGADGAITGRYRGTWQGKPVEGAVRGQWLKQGDVLPSSPQPRDPAMQRRFERVREAMVSGKAEASLAELYGLAGQLQQRAD